MYKLDTAEEIALALEREEALHRRAGRRREEFALIREMVLLGVLVTVVAFYVVNPSPVFTPISVGGLVTAVVQSRRQDS